MKNEFMKLIEIGEYENASKDVILSTLLLGCTDKQQSRSDTAALLFMNQVVVVRTAYRNIYFSFDVSLVFLQPEQFLHYDAYLIPRTLRCMADSGNIHQNQDRNRLQSSRGW